MDYDLLPEFSIIIPTHNRYEKLRNLLESINRLELKSLKEIIVVDDSDIKEDISSFSDGLKIRLISVDFRIYISHAKNLGLQAASTNLIFFIDDDNVVLESTFNFPIKLLSENELIGAVCPSVLYRNDERIVWVYATPFKKHRWGHELIGRNQMRNYELENLVMDIDALPNAFASRKDTLQAVGGFNENLPIYNSAFLSFSLKKKGFRVIAHTGSFILHDVELPSNFGFWAEHEIPDPIRVKIEIRDWFTFMKVVHSEERLFSIRAVIRSLSFILPNSAVYLLRGKKKKFELVIKEIEGALEGLKNTR